MVLIVQASAAVILGVLGLSQIYRAGFWLAYYQRLAELGPIAIRGHGAVVMAIGSLIAVLHPIWSGPAVVLTVFAWLLMAEGAFCLLAPQLSLHTLNTPAADMRRRAVVATGVGVLVVAGVLWAHLLLAG
ncbi:MAG: hypothetical protein SFV19_16340 [Rhodospirillaceae bacterium]|nr:hypothetical protein [Rhodospirillaceae bacterium]